MVSAWWATEARQYGVPFDQHDQRYARTGEWITIVDRMWREPQCSFTGELYQVQDALLSPKPVRRPRPMIYAGGESEAAKELISRVCDAYVMHGDPPDRIAAKVEDMRSRRARHGLSSLEDYSVSNRGLKSGLIGTPEQIAERILAFQRAGMDLLLLQFSPQAEEMERFAEQVMPLVGASAPTASDTSRAHDQDHDEPDQQGRDEDPQTLLERHSAAQHQ